LKNITNKLRIYASVRCFIMFFISMHFSDVCLCGGTQISAAVWHLQLSVCDKRFAVDKRQRQTPNAKGGWWSWKHVNCTKIQRCWLYLFLHARCRDAIACNLPQQLYYVLYRSWIQRLIKKAPDDKWQTKKSARKNWNVCQEISQIISSWEWFGYTWKN